MSALFRDTVFGHIVRAVTGGRCFQYQEEIDATQCLVTLKRKNASRHSVHRNKEGEGGGLEEHARSSFHTTDPHAIGSLCHTLSSGENFEDASTDAGTEKPDSEKASVVGPDRGQSRSNIGDPETLENAKDVDLVDWYGPEDPENPLNWSTAKKFFVTFQICLLTVSIYTGSSIYSPAIPNVAEIFGVSDVAAILGLTVFVLGYGLGPMLWSPMSEVPFIGRSPVYIGTLAAFVALQGAVVKSNSFGMLLAFRFLTGFCGSPVLATGGATCADMYRASKRAYAISIWGVAAVCGPALGPVIGGYVTEYGILNGSITAPWEWTMYTLMWLGAVCLLFLFFLLPETSASNILYRRSERLRKATGNSNLKSKPEIEAAEMSTSAIVKMCFVYPFTLNFMEPMVFFLNLYIALIYGLLYIWFESFPIVFMGIYGFTLGELGLAFLGILAGVIVVIPPFFWWIHKYLEPQFDSNGEIQPEKRLPACFVGAFCIPICLFWFGWSSRSDVHWIVPIIGTAWFSIGSFLLFIAILNYLPDAYPQHIASVLAGNDLFRSSFGAGFPLFAGAMYNKLGIGWASSTLAFISIAFIPIPFVLFKFGPTLRNRYSKIARKD